MTIGALSTGYSGYGYSYSDSLTAASKADEEKLGLQNGQDESAQKSADPDEQKKAGRRSSPADCETCKTRKYQDGSDETNVSFKTASHISPNAAGAAVRAHESQHVSNAYKEAAEDNGTVVNASVAIHTSICPECGRSYVSGGVTNTTIKYSDESNPYTQNQKALDALQYTGANVDYAA